MAELTFRLGEDQVAVELCINGLTHPLPDADSLKQLFRNSEFGNCLFIEESTEQILKAISDIIPAQEASNEGTEDESLQEQIVQLEEPLVFKVGEKRNASHELSITPDKMKATLKVITAMGGNNYQPGQIIVILNGAGVVKGIDEDAVNELCREVSTTDPGSELNAVVAEGTLPEPGVPTQFEYLVVPFQDRILAPQKKEDGSVDMHDLGDIEVVQPGKKLVKKIPAHPGEDGFTLEGEVLASEAPKDIDFNIGEGTKLCDDDPNFLESVTRGAAFRLPNGMCVNEVLTVDKVSLAEGNVTYDGAIYIKGDVAEGMLVKATKDVYIGGFVESAEIEAGGDIHVRKGVIGHEQDIESTHFDVDALSASLIAGGNIEIRYAQFAYLHARQDIVAADQLLHCHAKAGKSVIVGKSGQKKPKLVGGLIEALDKVSAGEIGTVSGSRIVICFSGKLNELYRKSIRLDRLIDEKQELIETLIYAAKRSQLRQQTPKLIEQREKIVYTITHTQNEIKELTAQKETLTAEIDTLKGAIHTDVYGHIHPGVEFAIHKERYKVKNTMPACTVRFRNEQIEYDPAPGTTDA